MRRPRVAATFVWGLLALLAAPPARALDPSVAVTQYPLQSWGRDRGLPSSSVLSVAQAADGYLWLGTYGGLVRFDGLRFVLFDRTTVPELRHGSAWRLLPGPDGTLWIGTNGGGLVWLRDGELGSLRRDRGLSSEVVTALAFGERGELFVGTRAGVDRVMRGPDGPAATRVAREDGSPVGDVFSMTRSPDGRVYVGTGTSVFEVRAGAASPVAAVLEDVGVPVTALLAGPDGTLWGGTSGRGLFERGPAGLRWHDASTGLPGDVVSALVQDGDGNLWIGTDTAGLARLRDGRAAVLTEAQGLANDSVASLALDREGSLWVGTTRNGLSRLRDAEVLNIGPREGLPAETVWHVFEDRDGSVWVSTSRGAARLVDRVVKGVVTPPSADPLVRAVFRDRSGRLWLATRAHGLVPVDERSGTARGRGISTAEGLPSPQVRSVCEDASGRLFLGTAAGLAVAEKGSVRSLAGVEGLPRGPILSLLSARDGRVWIGTDGAGLFAMTGTALTRYSTADGLGSDVVLGLFEDDRGVLWASTNGGLSRFDGRRFAKLGLSAGLPAEVTTQVLPGRTGLWLGGASGVARVERAELDAVARGEAIRVVPRVYGLPEGMRSDECNAPATGARTRDGRLWFPTVRGVTVFDPARPPAPLARPPVVVEEVVSHDVPRPAREGVRLGRDERTFEVRFAVLSLRAPERLRVAYRLAGLDPEWIEAGLRRSAFFTAVPPGDYRFEVVALPPSEPVGEPAASLPVRVVPAAWETGWARALGAALLLALAGLAVRRRLGQARRRARELEVQVGERTRELSQRNLELAAERERLGEANERLREADQLKAGFTAMLVHDLKSPLSVVGGALHLLGEPSRLGEAERGELLRSATRNLGRVLSLVEETLEVFRSETGDLPLQREPVDVAALLRASGESARIAGEGKRVTVDTDVPEGLPRVWADSGRLARVLENLLGNAVKFTPEGGWVVLSAEESPTGTGSVVRIRVADTGPGIPEAELQRIFEPYRQAGPRRGGVGLGLAIVRRFVEAHGGTVRAESRPGSGAVFTVEIPAGEPSPPPAPR